MPRRCATRRAVASRCAVITSAERRAASSTAGGAMAGVPLSKGGSGRVLQIELNGAGGVIAAQQRRQAQRPIDAGCDAGGKDHVAVDHNAFVDRDGAEKRQQMQGGPVRRRPRALSGARRRRKSARPCTPTEHIVRHRPGAAPIRASPRRASRFLPVAARHVQHVELRRLGERCVGQQAQPLHVAHGIERLGVDARRRNWAAGREPRTARSNRPGRAPRTPEGRFRGECRR